MATRALGPNSKKPHTLRETLLFGDEHELTGPLAEVVEKLLEIQQRAEAEKYFDVYIDMDKSVSWEYGDQYADVEIIIRGSRLETQEEIDARREAYRKKSAAAKKAAKARKEKEEAEVRKLYEKLKAKFENV